MRHAIAMFALLAAAVIAACDSDDTTAQGPAGADGGASTSGTSGTSGASGASGTSGSSLADSGTSGSDAAGTSSGGTPSTVTLIVDDKTYAVGEQASVKAGDLAGKRLSLDYEFGTEPVTETQARVTFRFGAPKGLAPGFELADVNQGYISITYLDVAASTTRTLYFEHTSPKGGCDPYILAGADGRVKGHITCSAVKPLPGDKPAVKLDFTYDLLQPPFEP